MTQRCQVNVCQQVLHELIEILELRSFKRVVDRPDIDVLEPSY